MCSEYVRCGFGCLVDQFLVRLEILNIVDIGDVVVSFRSVGGDSPGVVQSGCLHGGF